jgi:hypothetical protein
VGRRTAGRRVPGVPRAAPLTTGHALPAAAERRSPASRRIMSAPKPRLARRRRYGAFAQPRIAAGRARLLPEGSRNAHAPGSDRPSIAPKKPLRRALPAPHPVPHRDAPRARPSWTGRRAYIPIDETCQGSQSYTLGPLTTDIRARLRPHHERHRRGDDCLVRHGHALLRDAEPQGRPFLLHVRPEVLLDEDHLGPPRRGVGPRAAAKDRAPGTRRQRARRAGGHVIGSSRKEDRVRKGAGMAAKSEEFWREGASSMGAVG